VPVDRLGQDAAGQQADRAARGGDEAEHADGLGLLGGLREHPHDHRQHDGRAEGAAGALHEAGSDQHALGLGDRAEQRGAREHREPDEEDPSLADQVAQAPREQQQAAERDHVGVDHPGEVALGEAQVILDGRQRDVDDRAVDDDHQHGHAEHVEGGPAVVLVQFVDGHRDPFGSVPLAAIETGHAPGIHRRVLTGWPTSV
jgi:hypothetical protein